MCLSVPVFKGSSTKVSQSNTGVPMINITLTNATYLVIGTITFLKQYNPIYRNQFIAIIGQFVRSSVALSGVQRPTDLPCEVSKVVSFLDEFLHFSDLDKKVSLLPSPKINNSLFFV